MAVYGEEVRWHSKWSKVHLFIQVVKSHQWIHIQVVNLPVTSLGRSYRPPPRTSSLSPALQNLQFKHLFFNIDKLQLQIQLLHQLPLVTVVNCDRRKKQGFGYNPWNHINIQPHPPTGMENCRATWSLDAELRMLNDDVTWTLSTFWKTINLPLECWFSSHDASSKFPHPVLFAIHVYIWFFCQ